MRKRIKDMPALIRAVTETVPKSTYFSIEASYNRHDGRRGENRSIDFKWRIYRYDFNESWDGQTAQDVWDAYSRHLADVKRKKKRADVIPTEQAKLVGKPEIEYHGK